uniref:Uncharacterized protein n=1 Tax=Cacopsylla melanoneura TaxID=428564 RepID=A0A8D8X6J0_9HEMI
MHQSLKFSMSPKILQSQVKAWSTKETSLIQKTFGELIRRAVSKKCFSMFPSKDILENFIQDNELNRSWRNVKDRIRNEINLLEDIPLDTRRRMEHLCISQVFFVSS